MDILPAIDLVDGKCVRLIQGQYDRQIDYNPDPVEQARQFRQAGAEWLHIVDLDGARLGRPANIDSVRAIADVNLGLKIELGGGIRNEKDIKQVLDIGICRAIIGTSAVNQFNWFTEMTHAFPQKLVLGLDGRGAEVSTQGWTVQTGENLSGFAAKAANLPIAAIIYTDITKDGMMAGPNLERTKTLVQAVDLPVIAAGGVTKTDDIKKLAEIGVAGAIIGRALYEGRIDLTQALKTAQDLNPA